MLLFKPEHVSPILSGRKTQTRRIWIHGPRCLVGSVHQARLRMLDKSSTFALLRIKRVWRVRDLRETTQAEAWAEGYDSVAAYLDVFRTINKWSGPLPTERDADVWPIWAVEFEVMLHGKAS
ncbi:MAG: hypothetical protein Q8R28_11180 [Dehalococcoidia bacterium]|nr:hypothetical protein [Dehalococcoidia bacterium]